ncbi:MAG TPA: hypothetical protein VHS09_09660 [Polyangiaceae bacterium]|jgi:hypothetical protein|nr:hypothetical protein [Polyangiaceae bacterium]
MKIQLISLAAAVLTAACGAAPGTEDGTSSSAEPVAAIPDLTGAFSGASSAQFATIVLDPTTDASGHYTYFLDEHAELVSCKVGSGCTVTHERESGYYSATATHLTLHPTGFAERVYSYTRKGASLTLTRSGVAGSYAEVTSYCDSAADCGGQGLVRPECDSPTSGWECSATAHTCSYACMGAK